MRHVIAVALAALLLGACQQATPDVDDVTEPGVVVGAQRTCAELDLSDIRCTTLVLRAAATLDAERPDHADVTGQTLHEEADPPAGTTNPPRTTTIPLIVVFTLEDGSRVAVPTHCPREPASGDQGCDLRVR